MIYELFFKAVDRDITLEMFQNYFDGLANYRVEGAQAFYDNKDTGVFFVFKYLHEDEIGKPDLRSEGGYQISLMVDYCVPAFFITEALYEVEAIINNMKLSMYDPQPEGVGGNGYDPEIMFESWICQNEEAIRQWAVESARNGDNDEPVVAPYDWFHKVWLWNYNKLQMQHKLGDNIYVPAIKLLTDGKIVKVGIIWPDGKPIAMPKVDLVIISRSTNDAKSSDHCVVSYDDIRCFVDKYTSYIEGDAYILSYDSTPDDILDFVESVKPEKDFRFIDMDEILEEEIVEEALFP